MIARRWHGRVPAAKAEEYLRLSKDVGLADYRSTEGNRGAWCLHRTEGDIVHVEMFTLWDDLEAVRRFAGDELTKAKYYDFDPGFLLEMEPEVLHFEVIREIQQLLPGTPIVMHGSSSVPEEEVRRINAAGGKLDPSARGVDEDEYLPAARLGVTKINIDTDGRLVWTRVHREFFRDHPAEFNFMAPGQSSCVFGPWMTRRGAASPSAVAEKTSMEGGSNRPVPATR